MKKILISGSNGFIGKNLINSLEKKYSFTRLTRKPSNDALCIYDDRLQSELNKAKFDVFIHLATNYKKINNEIEIKEILNDNVVEPYCYIKKIIKSGTNKIINTGTYFEYSLSELPITEKSTKKPFNDYAISKILLESYLKTHDIDLITLKLMTPYGPHNEKKLIYQIISNFIAQVPIELSEGYQKIDLIYIDDVISAYDKSIKNILDSNTKSKKDYVISSGESHSIREIVEVIKNTNKNKKFKVKFGKPSTIDPDDVYGSYNKILNDMGWKPTVSLEEGLRNTINFYEN